jgi:hypothetical protein
MNLELINYKDLIVRKNENNSLSPRSSQTDSFLVDRILNANKRFRDQDIDDTANDADINLSCEVNIISNAIMILMLKLKSLKNHQIHRPLLSLTNRMI